MCVCVCLCDLFFLSFTRDRSSKYSLKHCLDCINSSSPALIAFIDLHSLEACLFNQSVVSISSIFCFQEVINMLKFMFVSFVMIGLTNIIIDLFIVLYCFRWDIIAERLGFMLVFLDLVFISFTFTIRAWIYSA